MSETYTLRAPGCTAWAEHLTEEDAIAECCHPETPPAVRIFRDSDLREMCVTWLELGKSRRLEPVQ